MKKLGSGTTANRIIHTLGTLAMVAMVEVMLTFACWLLIEAFAPSLLPPSRIALTIGAAAGALTALAFATREWMGYRDLAWVASEKGALVVGRGRQAPRRIDGTQRPEVVVEVRESTGKARHVRFTVQLRTPEEEFVLLVGGTRDHTNDVLRVIKDACPDAIVHAPAHSLA